MEKLLVILGPTATGKTDLALKLAKKLNGELVSCDSRQVYKGLDIGTGKLPNKEVEFSRHQKVWVIDGVPVWLYDVVQPDLQYDVWQYVQDAKEVIAQICKAGKLPILVGGTGMYLKALLEGFSEINIPTDPNLREQLEKLSKEELQEKLADLDLSQFEALNNSEINNKRRLTRRIEKKLQKKEASDSEYSEGINSKYQILKIGLTTERGKLYQRIDERVIRRVKSGMIEEGERLRREGLSIDRMRNLGLEYGCLADLMEGKIKNEQEFVTKLQFKIHQFAKRQLTWFMPDHEINWYDIEDQEFSEKVEEKVLSWYN